MSVASGQMETKLVQSEFLLYFGEWGSVSVYPSFGVKLIITCQEAFDAQTVCYQL